jgi:CPA1 family monovalent cation:H+ antiporter
MQLGFQSGTLLLLIAAVVAILTKRLRLPYSAGLVAAGIGLAAIPYVPRILVTKDLIYTGLLPPLLFEAAYNIHWDRLRRNFPVVAVLVSLGVALSMGLTAAGMHQFAHWPWSSAFIFGALIAATDPVSVVAVFREARAHGRLLLLIEAESLMNDGTASVAFAVAVAMATGQAVGGGAISLMLVKSIGGALICGVIVGSASLLLTGRTEDHLVETTFTTVAAYGSFLLADSFGMSGVLATIAAGLTMRNFKRLDGITPRGKEAVQNFWEYAAFIANSMVFLLIGVQQKNEPFLAIWAPVMIAVGVVLAARAVAVYSCCGLFGASQLAVPNHQKTVLIWGGLRGALALALALGLPRSLPMRNEIVTVSFGVVAFSIFVQGLTIHPLLRRFGEIPGKAEAHRAQEEAKKQEHGSPVQG